MCSSIESYSLKINVSTPSISLNLIIDNFSVLYFFYILSHINISYLCSHQAWSTIYHISLLHSSILRLKISSNVKLLSAINWGLLRSLNISFQCQILIKSYLRSFQKLIWDLNSFIQIIWGSSISANSLKSFFKSSWKTEASSMIKSYISLKEISLKG